MNDLLHRGKKQMGSTRKRVSVITHCFVRCGSLKKVKSVRGPFRNASLLSSLLNVTYVFPFHRDSNDIVTLNIINYYTYPSGLGFPLTIICQKKPCAGEICDSFGRKQCSNSPEDFSPSPSNNIRSRRP